MSPATSLRKVLKQLFTLGTSASLLLSLSAQAAVPQGCNWAKWAAPFSSPAQDPYGICFAEPSAKDEACFEGARGVRADDATWVSVRREQLKLILSQEVAYASRFAALSHDGVDHWQALKARLRTRLAKDPQVAAYDRDLKRGRDRCSLAMVAGLPCEGIANFDILGAYQARATVAEKNRNQGKAYPQGITYELIRAVVLLETLNVSKPTDVEKQEAEDTINSVLNRYPELAVGQSLRLRVKNYANRRGLLAAAKKIKADEMSERLGEIDDLMLQFNTRPLLKTQVESLEEMFFIANRRLVQILESQIESGRRDRDSAFDQDYLLYALARREYAQGKQASAGLLQAAICGNSIVEKRTSQRLEVAKLSLAALGLLTGIGAMFDVGLVLSAVFVGTMTTSALATTAIDLYQVSAGVSQQLDLFALKAVSYSELKDAEDRKSEAIPWAIVNVASIAPIFVLAKIHSAKTAAELAGDVAKVQQLQRYQKATVRIAVGMGISMTALQLPVAYDAAKDIVDMIKDPKPLPSSEPR